MSTLATDYWTLHGIEWRGTFLMTIPTDTVIARAIARGYRNFIAGMQARCDGDPLHVA